MSTGPRGLLLLTAILGIAAWLWLPNPQAPIVPARHNPAEPAQTSPQQGPATFAHRQPERINAQPAAASNVAGAAATTNGFDGILHGTFAVVDASGIEHSLESGTVSLATRSSDGSWHLGIAGDVHVEEGRWQTIAFAKPDQMRIFEAQLGGQVVNCETPIPITNPSRPIALRGRWLPQQTLNVIDAASGDHLCEVELVTMDHQGRPIYQHPGNQWLRTEVQHAQSPIQFTARTVSNDHTYWARAKGYAWQSIRIDTKHPATQVVALQPGGSLIVDTRQLPALIRVVDLHDSHRQTIHWANIRIRDASPAATGTSNSQPFLKMQPVSNKQTIIRWLPVGDWKVEVAANNGDPSTLIASAIAQVRAGKTTTVRMEQADRPRPTSRVLVDVSMVIPAQWNADVQLKLLPAGSTTMYGHCTVPFESMVLRNNHTYLSSEDLTAGDYLAVVDGTGYQQPVRIAGPERQQLTIEVPPPATVRLRVVDEVSGRPIEQDGWSPAWFWNPDQYRQDQGYHSMKPIAGNAFESRAPPGTIAIGAAPEGYLYTKRRFTITPGTNDLTLPMQRAFGIEITLHDGTEKIPWPIRLTAQLLDSNGKPVEIQRKGHRISVRQPGTYVLSLGHIASCERIADRHVQIPAGQWTHVTVAVRRMR